jgi:hypothetical protein
MKYCPNTKELFTDNGVFVKKMQCTEPVDWENMGPGNNDLERNCHYCNKAVLDIDHLSDEEVMFVFSKRPDTCVKISVRKG